MSSQDQQNLAYLQAIQGIAASMIAQIQNHGYWEGDLNTACAQIRTNLDRIREAR